jgi:outer membrane immunogenic protein
MTIRLIRLAATAAFLSAAAGAAPAFAQDVNQWTGFYIGGNLGVTSGNSKFSMSASAPPGSGIPAADLSLINATGLSDSNKTGFTGGVEGGYNWQSGSWLFGFEAEYSALNVNERSTATFVPSVTVNPPPNPPVTYTLNQRAKTSWMFTARPRIGYVTGPWLFYGTAGWASADVKSQLEFHDNRTPQHTIAAQNTSSRSGYAAGLGAAYEFHPGLSLKGEWLYAGFGTVRSSATDASGFITLTSKTTVDTNIFRAGLDWKF